MDQVLNEVSKMKNKRNLLIGTFILVFSFAYIFNAFAHSGRTDSSGGHNDNFNESGLGSYHYHCGGNPPHLHIGRVCPYDLSSYSSNNNTNSSSVRNDSGTVYSKYDEGWDDGYITGCDDGYSDGYEEGYDTGYDEGNSTGYEEGYEEGKSDGRDEGYEEGYIAKAKEAAEANKLGLTVISFAILGLVIIASTMKFIQRHKERRDKNV